jgi:uncharacterized protein
MAEVTVKKPTADELAKLGVDGWGVWEKEPSEFPWSYEEKETCYILEGEAEVSYLGRKAAFKAGDLVVFPKGIDCVWKIRKRIRKRYLLG